MRYKKAQDILPGDVLELLQSYVDCEYIYIPRKEQNRKSWGESTGFKEETKRRNSMIYQQYIEGKKIAVIAEDFYLSEKSIQRIITQERKNADIEP